MTTAPTELARTETTDDAGNATHIVFVPEHLNVSPQALVMEARVEGIPVTALCGHTWIPQRDPKPLPVCSRCLDIYQQPGDHRDERDELPEA
jgi:hypothetical protein